MEKETLARAVRLRCRATTAFSFYFLAPNAAFLSLISMCFVVGEFLLQGLSKKRRQILTAALELCYHCSPCNKFWLREEAAGSKKSQTEEIKHRKD